MKLFLEKRKANGNANANIDIRQMQEQERCKAAQTAIIILQCGMPHLHGKEETPPTTRVIARTNSRGILSLQPPWSSGNVSGVVTNQRVRRMQAALSQMSFVLFSLDSPTKTFS